MECKVIVKTKTGEEVEEYFDSYEGVVFFLDKISGEEFEVQTDTRSYSCTVYDLESLKIEFLE